MRFAHPILSPRFASGLPSGHGGGSIPINSGGNGSGDGGNGSSRGPTRPIAIGFASLGGEQSAAIAAAQKGAAAALEFIEAHGITDQNLILLMALQSATYDAKGTAESIALFGIESDKGRMNVAKRIVQRDVMLFLDNVADFELSEADRAEVAKIGGSINAMLVMRNLNLLGISDMRVYEDLSSSLLARE